MTADSNRVRRIDEDNSTVLTVAEQMLEGKYLKLCRLLNDLEQDNERLCKRVADLEAMVARSQHTGAMERWEENSLEAQTNEDY